MRKKRQKEKQQKKEEQKQQEIQQRQKERAERETINHIIQTLEETDMKPQVQIERIVTMLGMDVAMERLQAAEQVETEGGLMRFDDTTKRRTKGGVFFFLVKQWLREQERLDDLRTIFNRPTGAGKARKEAEQAQQQDAQDTQDAPADTPALAGA